MKFYHVSEIIPANFIFSVCLLIILTKKFKIGIFLDKDRRGALANYFTLALLYLKYCFWARDDNFQLFFELYSYQ